MVKFRYKRQSTQKKWLIFLRRQHDRAQSDAQGFSPLFFESTDQQESIRMVHRTSVQIHTGAT